MGTKQGKSCLVINPWYILLHRTPPWSWAVFLSGRLASALLEGQKPSETNRKIPVLIVLCRVLFIISHLMPIFCALRRASALPITYTTATRKHWFEPFWFNCDGFKHRLPFCFRCAACFLLCWSAASADRLRPSRKGTNAQQPPLPERKQAHSASTRTGKTTPPPHKKHWYNKHFLLIITMYSYEFPKAKATWHVVNIIFIIYCTNVYILLYNYFIYCYIYLIPQIK